MRNNLSDEKREEIALEMTGGRIGYWTEWERILASSIPQSAIWLVGNGKLNDLNDPAQARMVAEERNATVKSMLGRPSEESDDEVMRWIMAAVDVYAKGDYGEWNTYLYQPKANGMQPIVTSVPQDTIKDFNGWIKAQKTDLDGNPLAGATFTVYEDSACQVKATSFTTGSNGWGYADLKNFMTTSTKTFYVKETSAPPGYVGSTKPYQVVVSSTNNSTKETAAAVNGGAPIKNGKPQTPTGIVNKVDQAGNGIGPATFHFVSLTNGVETDRVCDETGTLELQWDDPSGENYLEPGEYTVTEKIAPPGYELSDEVQNLRLWIEEVDGVPTPKHSGPLRISRCIPSSSRR